MTESSELYHPSHPLYQPPADLSKISQVCYDFAKEMHAEDVRLKKGSVKEQPREIAYITHPAMVYRILQAVGVTDEVALGAAFLHDVMEDCDPYNGENGPKLFEQHLAKRLQIAQVKDPAGIARLVTKFCGSLTNAKEMGQNKRTWQFEHVVRLSPLEKVVKLADQIASMIDDILLEPTRPYAQILKFNMKAREVGRACYGDNLLLNNLLRVVFADALSVMDGRRPDAKEAAQSQALAIEQSFDLDSALVRAKNYRDKRGDAPRTAYYTHPDYRDANKGLLRMELNPQGEVAQFRVPLQREGC